MTFRSSRFLWAMPAFATFAIALALFFLPQPATSGIIESSEDFDHMATGFPLIGRHQLLTCESCHLNGVFKGLPRTCSGCHDGSFARGKHAGHVSTVEQCDVCHTPRGFGISAIMDHTTTTALCVTCHNGDQASGKVVGHVASSNNCGACHVTVAWSPVLTVDHEELNQGIPCETCHNGRDASGKIAGHILSSDRCGACHETQSFSPAAFVDHTQVFGSCGGSKCHASDKPADHASTTSRCESCHTYPNWAIVPTVDHSQVAANRCTDCHTANSIAVIGVTAVAVGQPADHIPTAASCDLCHTTAGWIPSTFTHAKLGIVDNCVLCHRNENPSPIRATPKPLNHINATGICEACHKSTGPGLTAWRRPNMIMDHSQTNLSAQRCDLCHSAGTGFTTKGPNHVVTTEDCGLCHSTAKWIPAAVDHGPIVNNCFSCHNGVDASGKAADHLQTSNECQLCHNKFPRLWADIIGFDHTQTTVTTCQTCHNGTQAAGKPTTHATTSDTCASCHVNTQWKPVTAVDHTQATGPCMQCHNGTVANAAAKSSTHPTTSDTCQACHNTASWIVTNVDHSQATGPCAQCHTGTVAAAPVKPVTHPTTTNLCDACHVPDIPWKPLTKMDHAQATGPCAQCHNGVIARFKPLNHPLTSDVCAGCHQSTVAWKPIVSVDHTQVAGTCEQCHNGVIAAGKNVGHVVTAQDCGFCHNTNAWIPAAIDHTNIVNNCASCHGVTASGKSGKHLVGLNTSNLCENCHDKFPRRWINVLQVDHSQVSGTCVSCHNGTLATGKVATHPPTSDNCGACHSTITFKPTLRVDHNEVQGASCAVAGCHSTLPANHIAIRTPFNCDACHLTAPATWRQIKIVDHAEVVGACASCHNGTVAKGFGGKHLQGMATTSSCELCHNVPPLTFNPARRPFDHSQTSATCVSCHNNTLFVGKGVNHINSTDDCAGCHRTAAWTIAGPPNHQFVLGTCESCHLGDRPGNHCAYPAGTDCAACHLVPPANWGRTTADCPAATPAPAPAPTPTPTPAPAPAPGAGGMGGGGGGGHGGTTGGGM